MPRAGRFISGLTALLVVLGATVSRVEAQETTTTTTTTTTTSPPPFPQLFLDDLTINKEVVGTPDAGSTFTVAFWCVPGIGPGGAVLPSEVSFDAQGHPLYKNRPGWLKGRAATCLLSETVARDPRTGTILRGDDGGATSVSFECAIGRGLDRPDGEQASCDYLAPDVFAVQFTGAGNSVVVTVVNTFTPPPVIIAPAFTG